MGTQELHPLVRNVDCCRDVLVYTETEETDTGRLDQAHVIHHRQKPPNCDCTERVRDLTATLETKVTVQIAALAHNRHGHSAHTTLLQLSTMVQPQQWALSRRGSAKFASRCCSPLSKRPTLCLVVGLALLVDYWKVAIQDGFRPKHLELKWNSW
jgi:hypothetical protein